MKSTLAQRAMMYERMPDAQLTEAAKKDVMALSVMKQRNDMRSRMKNMQATPQQSTVADDVRSAGLASMPGARPPQMQQMDKPVDAQPTEAAGIESYAAGGGVKYNSDLEDPRNYSQGEAIKAAILSGANNKDNLKLRLSNTVPTSLNPVTDFKSKLQNTNDVIYQDVGMFGNILGMAQGGIVKYADGGDVVDIYGADYKEKEQEKPRNTYGRSVDISSTIFAPEWDPENAGKIFTADNYPVASPRVTAPPVAGAVLKQAQPQTVVPAADDSSYGIKFRSSSGGGGLGSLDKFNQYIKDHTTDYFSGINDELKAQKGDYANDREKAKGLALMKAGLGVMAGKSSNAFQNFGAGASQGVDSYISQNKDISNRVDHNLAARAAMAKAQDAAERGDMKLAAEMKIAADRNALAAEQNSLYKASLIQDRARNRINQMVGTAMKEFGMTQDQAMNAVQAKYPKLFMEADYGMPVQQNKSRGLISDGSFKK